MSETGAASTPGRGVSETLPPMTGHQLGYARVSTRNQDPAGQHDALHGAGCWRIWTDTASGALARRPQLDAVLDQLRPGDTLTVTRLDRLGRNARHLAETVEQLEARGVGFRSLTEALDTTTATGRLTFHVFAALADFERSLISERTRDGLTTARTHGRVGGRPATMTDDKLAAAHRMHTEGASVTTIARTLSVGRATVYRHLTPTTDSR